MRVFKSFRGAPSIVSSIVSCVSHFNRFVSLRYVIDCDNGDRLEQPPSRLQATLHRGNLSRWARAQFQAVQTGRSCLTSAGFGSLVCVGPVSAAAMLAASQVMGKRRPKATKSNLHKGHRSERLQYPHKHGLQPSG